MIKKTNSSFTKLDQLENKLSSMQKKYSHYLEETERKKRREHDVHLSKSDKKFIVSSFLGALVLEQGLKKVFI